MTHAPVIHDDLERPVVVLHADTLLHDARDVDFATTEVDHSCVSTAVGPIVLDMTLRAS